MSGQGPTTAVVIGLSAVVVAIREGEAVVLTVRPQPEGHEGLPFGPFDPEGHRTFELAMRAFVTAQTRFNLGYVEQLYTFGDKGRDAPPAGYALLIEPLPPAAAQARYIQRYVVLSEAAGYKSAPAAAFDTE